MARGEIDKEEDVPIVDGAVETEEERGGQNEEGDEDTAVFDNEAVAEGFVGEVVSWLGLRVLGGGGKNFLVASA